MCAAPLVPLLNEVPQTWKFNGTLTHPSPYKGPPDDSVDDAWDRLYNCWFHPDLRRRSSDHANAGHDQSVNSFRISPEQLERIGGKPFAAKFPDEAGGGYIGFMEVLHQLHCIVRRRVQGRTFIETLYL